MHAALYSSSERCTS